MGRSTAAVLLLCALAGIAYLPALQLPFIADDYVQIQLARDYGPVEAWSALARDPLYRCRATSLVLTYWTEWLFGLSPLAFRLSSLLLHILNAIIVLCLGAWNRIGWKRSLVAAAFFAIAEGHQEAVIWYAAVPELLVFLFTGISFTAFLLCITGDRHRPFWYGVSLLSFLLALASKESGVLVIGALIIVAAIERLPVARTIRLIAPFGLLVFPYVYAIIHSRDTILHFHDGAFSFNAPFVTTIINSAGSVLWFWGLPAIVALVAFDWRTARSFGPASLLWMCASLLPYSFLTYMHRVPSRHTYFASVGLSLLVGAGLVALSQSRRRALVSGILPLILLHNVTYLWTRKQDQYRKRAEPTEQLIRAYQNSSSVVVECWPYSPWIARYAAEIGAGKPWEEKVLQQRGNCHPEETVISGSLEAAGPPSPVEMEP